MTFHRILLLNRNHIGDCLFTTPAIRALRRAYPEAVLVAAVPPANHDLLANNPCLNEVLVRPLRGVSGQFRLLQEIRRRRFDLVISFQEKSFFYAALARLSGAALTVSLQHWRTQPFYDRTVTALPGRHEVEKYHSIAQAAADPIAGCGSRIADWEHDLKSAIRDPQSAIEGPGAMELRVSREHRAWAEAWLAEWRMDEGGLLIGLNPGATMEIKRWPVERFAAVGRELVRRYEAKIMVFGGPGDEQRAEFIASAVPGAVSVAGKTRLGETAALLRHCRLMISGDTGPLHMAVALGVPVIGLFGPTNPSKYGPWVEPPPRSNNGSHPGGVPSGGAGPRVLDQSETDSCRTRATVVRHDKPCGLCERPCLHTISVEECVAAAEGWLSSRDQPLLAQV